MTLSSNVGHQLHHSVTDPGPPLDAMEAPVQRQHTDGDGATTLARSQTNIDTTQPQPPINESVAYSLNEAQTSGVSPALVAAITNAVLKEIEARNHPNTAIPPHFYPRPNSGIPRSPTASSYSQTLPPREPSPKSSGKQSEYKPTSPSHPVPTTHLGRETTRSPSPLPAGSGHASAYAGVAEAERPDTAVQSDDSGETTLEKIWGKFFDEGKPTTKLGQLLRGMANYMIEKYEPQNSIVVTPQKMQQYYRETHITHEPYPWKVIFDERNSYIGRMYRQLGCEHHLVQEPGNTYGKPDIPGLTPHGFEQWATMMIRAHPDEAFERLLRIVREFPINNPDNRTERFPKDLPRRLFPHEPDYSTRNLLVDAIETHAEVSIKGVNLTEPPRQHAPARPPAVLTTDQLRPRSRGQRSEASDISPNSPIERERSLYASGPMTASSTTGSDKSSTQPTSGPPLERERKPYTAREGEGRTFDISAAPTAPEHRSPSAAVPNGAIPPPPRDNPQFASPSQPSLRRSGSNTVSSTRPINVPTVSGPPRQRGDHPPPPLAASATFSTNLRPIGQYGHRNSIPGRPRGYSPPPSAPFRSSESDLGVSPRGMSSSFDSGPFWDKEEFRRPDHLEHGRNAGISPPPPPTNVGRRPDHSFNMSPRRRMSGHEEDFYRPRRESMGGR